MVFSKICANKPVPTVNSTCKVIIIKVSKTGQNDSDCLDSEYLLREGEVDIDLEEVNTPLDRKFIKFLLKTKLEETVTFNTSCLDIEFKLLNIETRPSIHEMSDVDKVSRAKHHKEMGSQLFKQNKHEAAFHRFRTSVQYLIFLNDKTTSDADDMYAMVCNNMAMCQIKFNNHQFAIDLCCKVLKVEESNVKALYRRAVCYMELKRYDEAHADLKLAHSKENKDQSIMKLLDIVQNQLKIQHEQYKSVVKNMFR